MNKRCCFAGHGKICPTDDISDNLANLIEKLITEENVSDFWVGNYGDFDKLSAKAVRNLKVKYPNIQLNLVIPLGDSSTFPFYRNQNTLLPNQTYR